MRLKTGFAVITPLDGNIKGLVSRKNLARTSAGLFSDRACFRVLWYASSVFTRSDPMRHSIRESPSLIQMRSRQRSCCH